MKKVLVLGSSDVGSAVAWTLFQAGMAVMMHDLSLPTTTRRKMAYSDAIFEGSAVLENVVCRFSNDGQFLAQELQSLSTLLLTTMDLAVLRSLVAFDIFIDARMKKRSVPNDQRSFAPLTIGLGPNFSAGENIHIAIETSWENLGNIVTCGKTMELKGEPKSLGGHARERYVYAPCAGIFYTTFQVGDAVYEGQCLASIDHDTKLFSPLSGRLRGILRSEIPVSEKTKIIEVDPRPEFQISGIAERPRKIAAGVLQAILISN